MQDIKTVLGETRSEFKNARQADSSMSWPWKGRQAVCLSSDIWAIRTVLGETEVSSKMLGRQTVLCLDHWKAGRQAVCLSSDIQAFRTVLGEIRSELKNTRQADSPMYWPLKGRHAVCLSSEIEDIRTVLGENRSEFKNARQADSPMSWELKGRQPATVCLVSALCLPVFNLSRHNLACHKPLGQWSSELLFQNDPNLVPHQARCCLHGGAQNKFKISN